MKTVVIEVAAPRKRGGGYPLRLLTMDAAGALAPLRGATASLPADLSVTAERLQQLKGLFGNTDARAADFEQAGAFLFGLLSSPKIEASWRSLRRADTRFILHVPNVPALADLHALPWELLCKPNPPDYLALLEQQPFSRASALDAENRSEDWPLRVLVVNGAEPRNGAAISAEEEILALEKVFAANRADVEYELLESPQPQDILAQCRKLHPHVLHFIGHGESGPTPADHKLLIHRDGMYQPWNLPSVRAALQSVLPRFAFLSACRTSDARKQESGLVSALSFADALLEIGTLGVIGMQGDIWGASAAEFAGKFYQRIIAGDAVDLAVAAARGALAQCGGGVTQHYEWALPVLKTRTMPDRIMPVRPKSHTPAHSLPRIVDRVAPRWRLRETLRATTPIAPARTSPHLVVVTGAGDCGKSHLAEWCAQMCRWRGSESTYVRFGGDSADLFSTLRWIRDGRRPEPNQRPVRAATGALPAEAFRRFNWELNWQLQGRTAPIELPKPPAAIDDEGRALAYGEQPQEGMVKDTLGQFRFALEEVARPKGLVLFLDHLEGLETTALTQWLPQHLFQPVAAGQVSGTRIVLTMRKDELEGRMKSIQALPTPPTVIELESFTADDFPRLSRNLCLQFSEKIYNELWGFLQNTFTRSWGRPATWGRQVFEGVEEMCEGFTKGGRGS